VYLQRDEESFAVGVLTFMSFIVRILRVSGTRITWHFQSRQRC
jgi:hypothetical protein